MAVTVRGTDILFNDGTTQSTAAGTSAKFDASDSIGSVQVLYYSGGPGSTTSTQKKNGDTISGSYLFRSTSAAAGYGTGTTSATNSAIALLHISGSSRINQTTAFSSQAYPSGTWTATPATGTWRFLSSCFGAMYDGYSMTLFYGALVIRIA